MGKKTWVEGYKNGTNMQRTQNIKEKIVTLLVWIIGAEFFFSNIDLKVWIMLVILVVSIESMHLSPVLQAQYATILSASAMSAVWI